MLPTARIDRAHSDGARAASKGSICPATSADVPVSHDARHLACSFTMGEDGMHRFLKRVFFFIHKSAYVTGRARLEGELFSVRMADSAWLMVWDEVGMGAESEAHPSALTE